MSTDLRDKEPLGFDLTLFGKLSAELQERIITVVPEKDRPNLRLTCRSLDTIARPYTPHMVNQTEAEHILEKTSRAPVGIIRKNSWPNELTSM
jgi:hypothetical protein